MTARAVFTAEAEAQLLDIFDHIAADSEEAAVCVQHALYDAANRLAETPETSS